MFGYNVRIALRSLRRNPGLTAVLVSGLGVGIGVAVTFATLRHAFASHPLPAKEATLRYVRLDSWDPQRSYPGRDGSGIPTQVTYRDMQALTRSTIPSRQTANFRATLFLTPEKGAGKPSAEQVRLCSSDFFAMFEAPFLHGGPWDRRADAGPEAVVVLTDEMNDRLFGGANSVGKTVRLGGRDFRVVGVLDRWRPNIRVWDLTQQVVSLPEPFFLPFAHVLPMQIRTAGNVDGWGPSPGSGAEAFLRSESTWIQLWVELPDAAAEAAYRSFVEGYIAEQKKAGRFQRPLRYELTSIRDLMDEFGVLPAQVSALFLVGLFFLAVAAVNLIGLLLGKFLARAHEVGVRRALGASRLDVFLQHIVECELVALLGGGVGVLLSLGAVAVINAWMKTVAPRGDLFRLDGEMLLAALLLSVLAGLVAGTYPSFRAGRLAPALGLKE
jgi:putative ABC transport system permease protein